MDVKHANCAEERLDRMLGDMNNNFCKQLYRDVAPCSCIGFLGMAPPPYTQSLKSASVEAFNGKSLNESGSVMHALAVVPKDKVCACGSK